MAKVLQLSDYNITESLVRESHMPKEYTKMAKRINKSLPAILRDSANFHKSHSQFMYSTLDVMQLTPIRSIKHTLAEIHKTKMALEENYVRVRREELALKKLQKKRKTATDVEELDLDILEKQMNVTNSTHAMQGALRKFSFFTEQYKSLLQSIGKTEKEGITEEEYEAEEEKYHIMTAMSQALTAARSRQGWICEGNTIYIFQLGINCSAAQKAIFDYLKSEQDCYKKNKEPTARMSLDWLEECAEKWKGCSKDIGDWRGVKTFTNKSLHIGEQSEKNDYGIL